VPQEMEQTILSEVHERIKNQKEGNIVAEASRVLRISTMDEKECRVADSKDCVDVKSSHKAIAESGAKLKTPSGISAKRGKDEMAVIESNNITKIKEDFSKEMESLKMETDVRFQNMNTRFVMIFILLALIIIVLLHRV
jgi:hypothetical protein